MLLVYFVFRVYATIIVSGNQKEPEYTLSKELKSLEKDIQKETQFADSYIELIPLHKFEDCHKNLKQYINISNNNDTLGLSKEKIYDYSKSIYS